MSGIFASRVSGRGNIFGSVHVYMCVCLFALCRLNLWTYRPKFQPRSKLFVEFSPPINSRDCGTQGFSFLTLFLSPPVPMHGGLMSTSSCFIHVMVLQFFNHSPLDGTVSTDFLLPTISNISNSPIYPQKMKS